jgi:nucleoside-diphosphate-sugar epimerase
MRPVCGDSFCAPRSRTCGALAAVLGASLHPSHLAAESLGARPHRSHLTRALVIGGAGFIGVAACKELMRRGVETVAAGRTPRPYGVFTSFHAFDARDGEQLHAALEAVQPDVVLDLSGIEPAGSGRRWVSVPCGGGDPAGEALSTAIRPGAALGPDDPTLRIAAYIQRVEDGGPLLVPAESWERPLHLAWVKDAGYACALACDPSRRLPEPAYDVAFAALSLRDLIAALGRALRREPRLVPVPFAELPEGASPYATASARASAFDLEPARRDLGFRPSTFEDALPEILAWYLARRPSHAGYANRAAELEIARAHA